MAGAEGYYLRRLRLRSCRYELVFRFRGAFYRLESEVAPQTARHYLYYRYDAGLIPYDIVVELGADHERGEYYSRVHVRWPWELVRSRRLTKAEYEAVLRSLTKLLDAIGAPGILG